MNRRVLIPATISEQQPWPDSGVHELAGDTMGTSWSVRLSARSPDLTALRQAIVYKLANLVQQMSHWEPESDLSRFNRAPAGSWHPMAMQFSAVLQAGLAIAAQSDGAYDPSAGALVNAWGFGAGEGFRAPGFVAPNAAARSNAQSHCGWRRLQLKNGQLLQAGGVVLDFSSIAKGYAVDSVCALLRRVGHEHFLVEIGGELRGEGRKADGSPWWVGLEAVPGNATDETLVALHGLAVATSGDYRRFLIADGRRLAHTIDPRTGCPVENGVASATVLHPQCMAADAFSTALTVLGPEQGMAFADRLGLAARMLVRTDAGLQEWCSAGFEAMLDDA